MATIGYKRDVYVGTDIVSDSSGSYSWLAEPKITLDANKTYLVLAHGQIKGDDVNLQIKCNIRINSVADGFEFIIEPNSVGELNYYTYSNFKIHTTGGSSEDVEFGISSSGSGNYVYADQIVLLAIDLSDFSEGTTSSDDYSYLEELDNYTFTTTPTTVITRDYSCDATSSWLLLWQAQAWRTAARAYQLLYKYASASTAETLLSETENTGDRQVWPIGRVYSLAAGTRAIEIDAEKTAVPGDGQIIRTRVLALNLTKIFSNDNFSYNESGGALSTTDFQSVIASTTLTGTGNAALAFGSIKHDPNAMEYQKFRLQLDNTDDLPPTQTEDAYQLNVPWDATQTLGSSIFDIVDNLSVGSHTIDFDASAEDTNHNAYGSLLFLLLETPDVATTSASTSASSTASTSASTSATTSYSSTASTSASTSYTSTASTSASSTASTSASTSYTSTASTSASSTASTSASTSYSSTASTSATSSASTTTITDPPFFGVTDYEYELLDQEDSGHSDNDMNEISGWCYAPDRDYLFAVDDNGFVCEYDRSTLQPIQADEVTFPYADLEGACWIGDWFTDYDFCVLHEGSGPADPAALYLFPFSPGQTSIVAGDVTVYSLPKIPYYGPSETYGSEGAEGVAYDPDTGKFYVASQSDTQEDVGIWEIDINDLDTDGNPTQTLLYSYTNAGIVDGAGGVPSPVALSDIFHGSQMGTARPEGRFTRSLFLLTRDTTDSRRTVLQLDVSSGIILSKFTHAVANQVEALTFDNLASRGDMFIGREGTYPAIVLYRYGFTPIPTTSASTSASTPPPPTYDTVEITYGESWRHDDQNVDRSSDKAVPFYDLSTDGHYDTSDWQRPIESHTDHVAAYYYGVISDLDADITLNTAVTDQSVNGDTRCQYFAKELYLSDVGQITDAVIKILQEDAHHLWINGTHVWQYNITGDWTHSQTSDAAKSSEGQAQEYTLTASDRSLLREGLNWICVTVHQFNSNSSDMAFDMKMTVTRLLGQTTSASTSASSTASTSASSTASTSASTSYTSTASTSASSTASTSASTSYSSTASTSASTSYTSTASTSASSTASTSASTSYSSTASTSATTSYSSTASTSASTSYTSTASTSASSTASTSASTSYSSTASTSASSSATTPPPPVPPRNLRPRADVSGGTGTWEDYPGRTDQFHAELIDEIDPEAVGDDSDGVLGYAVEVGDSIAFKLDPGTDITDRTGHKWHASLKTMGAGQVAWIRSSLWQGNPYSGGVEILESIIDIEVTQFGVTEEQNFGEADADKITDYEDLYFKVRVVDRQTDDADLLLYWVEFVYPGEQGYQFGKPIADSDSSGFATVVGDASNRKWYVTSDIEEASDEELSYVSETDVTGDEYFTVKIDTGDDPNTNEGHILETFDKQASGSKNITRKVELWQWDPSSVTDSYVIASFEGDLQGTNWNHIKYFLSTAEASLIVDYSELYIRYTITSAGAGTTTEVQVSKKELKYLPPQPITTTSASTSASTTASTSYSSTASTSASTSYSSTASTSASTTASTSATTSATFGTSASTSASTSYSSTASSTASTSASTSYSSTASTSATTSYSSTASTSASTSYSSTASTSATTSATFGTSASTSATTSASTTSASQTTVPWYYASEMTITDEASYTGVVEDTRGVDTEKVTVTEDDAKQFKIDFTFGSGGDPVPQDDLTVIVRGNYNEP